MDCSVPTLVNEIIKVGWQPKETARLLGITRDISSLYVFCSKASKVQSTRALINGDTDMFTNPIYMVQGKGRETPVHASSVESCCKGRCTGHT